jgi:undecaprenyl phosphate-alpha-L-ara4N flippase subunit ArnE
MSNFLLGNIYLLLSMLCSAGSQMAFKVLFNETGPLSLTWSFLQQVSSFWKVSVLASALALLVAAFLFWLMSLSRLDLSYAYAIACSSALIITFFSMIFLGEAVSFRMWCGTLLIVLGVMLLIPSR